MTTTAQKKIGIIGTGAVGTALAVLMKDAGYEITGLSGRNKERTESLTQRLGKKPADESNEAVIDEADVVFFCLPDDELPDEINRCANNVQSFKSKIVFHTSGALSSDLFEPMRAKGAHAASFHPLQTIPREGSHITLKDFAIALEGDQQAVDYGEEMVRRVGAQPLLIRPEQKIMYHSTATLASNGLVGLSGVVEEMLDAVGLGEEGRGHFYKLMEQSLENSRSMTPPDAITGPAARGDIATLKQHLHNLRQYAPHVVPLYVVIGSHCVSLAIQGGKLSRERGEAILDLFSNELQSLTL